MTKCIFCGEEFEPKKDNIICRPCYYNELDVWGHNDRVRKNREKGIIDSDIGKTMNFELKDKK